MVAMPCNLLVNTGCTDTSLLTAVTEQGELEKRNSKRAKSRPRRMWFDDVRHWTVIKDYTEVKRNAEDREAWRAI